MKKLLPILAVALSFAAAGKDIYVNVDFCDEILQRWKTLKRGMIAEDVTNIVRNCRQAGVDGIYLRVAPLGIVFHKSKVAWDVEGAVAKGQHSPSVVARLVEGKPIGRLNQLVVDSFRATMKSMPDSYGTFVSVCRHEGLKISFWIDIHDEMFGKFTTEHPECLVRTPDGKTFPALRDYGNETAVKDKLAELEEYFKYRPDGFFFCTSCHTRHMRIDDPDEAFGTLPAAKFTDFLRRVKASFKPYGFTLTMGTACGGTLDFCSPYFANHPKYRIGHDWKTWVDEGIADALVVADYERFNRRCDDFWRAKGVTPDGVNDPAERFLPEFTGYVKGRVPLYYHIRLPGKTPRELKEALETDGATVLKFGLDGANLHELMIIENRKGGFDMLADMARRFRDTAECGKGCVVWTKTISRESDRYCGWPTVCDIGGGEIAAVFSGDRNGHVCPWGKVRMVRSKDGGETWSASETVCSTALDDRDAGLLRLKDGSLVLFWFTSVHYYEHYHDDRGNWPRNPDYLRHFEKLGNDAVRRDLGSFSRRSTDGGRTWETPVRLPTSSPHGGIQLSDGRLMVVGLQGSQVRGRMRADPEEKALPGGADVRYVVVAESADGGRSWRECARIPSGTGEVFEEPHLIEGADGVLRCYARTRRNLSYSESRDGGRTWTVVAATSIPSWHNPPFLLRLKDGRTLLTYGRRVISPKRDIGWRTGVYARIGDRNATPASFEAAPEIAIHHAETVDMGYASTVECADGSLLTVFYVHDRPDAEVMAVKWRANSPL